MLRLKHMSFLSLLLVVGCSTTAYPTNECPRHNRPLIKEKGFALDPSVTVSMSGSWHQALEDLDLPHYTSYGFTTTRSELFTVPMSWTYCPDCDKELDDYIENLDEQNQ
jgi:hypothetical protein